MNKMKIVTIIGARPQIIKAAALSRAIKERYADRIQEIIVHTGQHYDDNMSQVFFDELGIPKPDYNLHVGSASHGVQTAKMIEGIEQIVTVRKQEWEPLGLCLDETEAMKPRHCRNRCLFCFVDQLPQGMRQTLYVKDDDWRLSLMMGNYVTLTNVDDKEFVRILRRKASPLYIMLSRMGQVL